MPTPLEDYLSKNKYTLLTGCFAIGTDNRYSDLLLQGVIKGRETDKDTNAKALPPTLAAYLVENKLEWTEERNLAWIGSMLRDPEKKAVYIYHDKICQAIDDGAIDGRITEQLFTAAYKGATNSSYKEIILVLKNGFNQVEYSGGDGTKGAILVRD